MRKGENFFAIYLKAVQVLNSYCGESSAAAWIEPGFCDIGQ